jgi:hypothetical protein
MFKQIKQFLGKAYRTAKLFTNPGKAATILADTARDVGHQYPPQVRSILLQYGDKKVVNIKLCREVVSQNTEFLLKALAGKNTWEEAKKKYGFDKFYHLFMIATLENGQKLHIEKNEVIRISPSPRACPDALELGTVNIPLSELLDKTRQRIGDNDFFSYDALGNNCQAFIQQLLRTMNLWSNNSKDFVFQDIEGLRKELPSYTKYIAKGLTDVGAFFNTAYQKTKDYIEYGSKGQEGSNNQTDAP